MNMHQRAMAAVLSALLCAGGCGSSTESAAGEDFHTSGSREADQRAEQRISKIEQMRGEGEGGAKTTSRPTLYARVGGEAGLEKIVADFLERAIQDPRVNWERKGVTKGGVLGIGSSSATWADTPQSRTLLAEHLRQFLALATGGPARYGGKDIKLTHQGMRITNAEFDACIGDMKATLDRLQVATPEQKELLAILESSRPQIAEQR
jgi:hemoglobin